MKIKYLRGFPALKVEVAEVGEPGFWKLRKDGLHRQFLTKSGGFLNYWETTGTIDFQRRRGGPLERHFAAAAQAASKKAPSIARRAVTVASGGFPDAQAPNPRAPVRMPALAHPDDCARASVLNERSRRIADVFKGVPPKTAAGELLFASIRQASTYMPEKVLHAALCAAAGEAIELGVGFRLFAQVDAIFRQLPDEEF